MAAMEKNNKTLNVPNLRFPEFCGEWEKYSLGEVGSTIIGLTYSPSDVVKDGGTIVLRSSNIQDGEIDYKDLVFVNKKIKDTLYTRPNDLLVCARNGSARLIGKNALIAETDSGHTFGAFMMIYRSEDNQFIHQLLSTKRYYTQVGENLGARINQITTSDMNSFEFYFPKSKSEKDKIAHLLGLINLRISTQKKVIEKYESLIRGLCEKLTRQGYANKSINECLECHSSTLQESEVLDTGRYPVYGAIGVCGYTDTPDVSGDGILIIKDGASVGVTYFADGCYSSIGTLNRLTAKQGINLRYVYYCLKVMNFAPYKTGLAIPHIYFKDYGKHKIWCPSFEQQSRIADALTSIDNKMHVEKSLLEHLNSQKRYVLKQLFI